MNNVKKCIKIFKMLALIKKKIYNEYIRIWVR